MALILLKYWKQLFLLIVIVASLYSGYSYVKGTGVQEATIKYTAVIAQYEKDITDKAKTIEVMSNVLATQQKASTDLLNKNINSILVSIKNKPLVVIKNQECTPSTTFSDSFLQINKQVNENIK
jgi:hypothetical protein